MLSGALAARRMNIRTSPFTSASTVTHAPYFRLRMFNTADTCTTSFTAYQRCSPNLTKWDDGCSAPGPNEDISKWRRISQFYHITLTQVRL